jgi:hypothetical protein
MEIPTSLHSLSYWALRSPQGLSYSSSYKCVTAPVQFAELKLISELSFTWTKTVFQLFDWVLTSCGAEAVMHPILNRSLIIENSKLTQICQTQSHRHNTNYAGKILRYVTQLRWAKKSTLLFHKGKIKYTTLTVSTKQCFVPHLAPVNGWRASTIVVTVSRLVPRNSCEHMMTNPRYLWNSSDTRQPSTG